MYNSLSQVNYKFLAVILYSYKCLLSLMIHRLLEIKLKFSVPKMDLFVSLLALITPLALVIS